MVFIIRLLFEAIALSEVAWGLLVEMKLVGVCQVASFFLQISTSRSTLHLPLLLLSCLYISLAVLCFLFPSLCIVLSISLSHFFIRRLSKILIIPVWNGGRYFCVQELDVFSCLFHLRKRGMLGTKPKKFIILLRS